MPPSSIVFIMMLCNVMSWCDDTGSPYDAIHHDDAVVHAHTIRCMVYGTAAMVVICTHGVGVGA
jgi:hypothetical protein